MGLLKKSLYSNGNNNEKEMSKHDKYLMAWNVTAAATVIIPLVFFGVGKLIVSINGNTNSNYGDDDDGVQGQMRQWWQQAYNWADGNADDGSMGKGSLIFVYVWSLILFIGLVWRGNIIISKKKDIRALFAAIIMFTNLAFMMWVLSAAVGYQQGQAEQGWIGQFSTAVILTFFLWTMFGIVFTLILYLMIRKYKKKISKLTNPTGRASKNSKSNNGDDYQLFEDDRFTI